MNKKIAILIVLMLVVILCFTFFLSRIVVNNASYKNSNKETNITSNDNNTSNTGDSTVKKNYTDEELKAGISYGDGTQIMTEPIAESIEQKARTIISQFNFAKAERYLADTLKEYDINNSPAFNKIEKLYHDLPSMAYFPYMLETGQINLLKDIIKDLEDSENFFISVMWLDRADRESFIYMNDSINPVFYGGVKVLKKEIVDEENINEEIRRRFEDIDEVIKFEFDIEDNILLAYIVKSNGKFHLFKIVEKEEGTTHYLTIKEWRDFYNKFNGNDSGSEKSIDNENIEDKITDDNSTTYIDLTEGDDS